MPIFFYFCIYVWVRMFLLVFLCQICVFVHVSICVSLYSCFLHSSLCMHICMCAYKYKSEFMGDFGSLYMCGYFGSCGWISKWKVCLYESMYMYVYLSLGVCINVYVNVSVFYVSVMPRVSAYASWNVRRRYIVRCMVVKIYLYVCMCASI